MGKANGKTDRVGEIEPGILSDILPLPDPRFKGWIGSTYADSEADDIALPAAPVKVDKEGKFGTGGTTTLRLGKKAIGEGRFEQQVAGYFTVNEGFDIGCDICSPVSDLCESPFPFTGTILRVMVDISEATFEDLAAQHEAHARLAMATQ